MRLSLILRKRRRGSINLQQSCNYDDGVERGDNNEDNRDKIEEINWNIDWIKINCDKSKSKAFYIEKFTKDDKNNENNSNEAYWRYFDNKLKNIYDFKSKSEINLDKWIWKTFNNNN